MTEVEFHNGEWIIRKILIYLPEEALTHWMRSIGSTANIRCRNMYGAAEVKEVLDPVYLLDSPYFPVSFFI